MAIGPASSATSTGVIPVPMQTPKRSGSIRPGLQPRVRPSPGPAAPTANPTARLISLALFLCSPRKGITSKFFTSPATLIDCPEVSMLSMSPTPDRPSTMASLKSRRPTPLGATTPIPVTTTRCIGYPRPSVDWLRFKVHRKLAPTYAVYDVEPPLANHFR